MIAKRVKQISRAGCLFFLFSTAHLRGEEESGHTINFYDVPVIEVIRFVSKISEVNFIFNNQDLDFNITLSSGKEASSENVLKALIQMLRMHGFSVNQEERYYVIHKGVPETMVPPLHLERREEIAAAPAASAPHATEGKKSQEDPHLTASLVPTLFAKEEEKSEFFVYKLQYHQGSEIEEAIKKIAGAPGNSERLVRAIHSMQWVKATNSLLFSADKETIESLKKLIASLDVALRQVFIEVLVIETDVKKGMEFGLEWALGGKYGSRLGFGAGNFPNNRTPSPFASTMQGINASSTPTGLGQIPIGSGFDLGVIGDLIRHKGQSYLTLGSLVSALQIDGSSTIVLNQKIITQDNKNSTIFVGDNIPFTGSVVQTVGQSQQTAANIEYRDIGVSLSITPMLGEGDIITLDIDEQITESLGDPQTSNTNVGGIRTTKTNMVTHVHVPDKHFLVLSGMIRNAKSRHKSGIPCLGGLPLIGAAFSKTQESDEKRNVIIFVRPHIIHSFEEFNKVTDGQAQVFEKQAAPGSLDQALESLPN